MRLWKAIVDLFSVDGVRAFPPVSMEAVELITVGLDLQAWKRMLSWLCKYKAYMVRSGRQGLTAPGLLTLIADNVIAVNFLASIAKEDRGRTRPTSAATAVDFLRRVAGLPPISDDPRVRCLKRGVLKSTPHTPKGARPFPEFFVHVVSEVWGSSDLWWQRMVALIIRIAFLTLLRGKGVLSIPSRGCCWIRGAVELMDPEVIPLLDHDGVLLVVPWRKTTQNQPSWVAMRRGRVTELLSHHLHFLRVHAPTNKHMFPARKAVFHNRQRQWVPNPSSPISHRSATSLLRMALREVCGLSESQAEGYSIHGLRVGGLNYYRRIGVTTSLLADLASHASIHTTRRYLRLLPTEQLQMLDSMVLPR